MSRMVRLSTQRVREMVLDLREQRTSTGSNQQKASLDEQAKDLEQLRTFTVAATNHHWADGQLPLQFALSYLEKRGEEHVCTPANDAIPISSDQLDYNLLGSALRLA
jgi:hypothetical protein